MDKSEILKIVLVESIASEIEELYSSGQITKDKFKEVFVSQEDLMNTVPSAIGEKFFEKKLQEMNSYVHLSEEILNDEEVDDKDIGFYLIDAESDLPDEYKNKKHINIKTEHLLWNITYLCVEEFRKKSE